LISNALMTARKSWDTLGAIAKRFAMMTIMTTITHGQECFISHRLITSALMIAQTDWDTLGAIVGKCAVIDLKTLFLLVPNVPCGIESSLQKCKVFLGTAYFFARNIRLSLFHL
jgi:hypothetical protein